MKGQLVRVAISASISLLLITSFLLGCNSQVQPAQPVPSSAAGGKWEWPKLTFISASGQSGMAKEISWSSVMEQDTGMSIRVVPEESTIKRITNVKSGQMLLFDAEKTEVRSSMEALEERATRDAGPWQIRLTWVTSLANAGWFVRGDSPIKGPRDVKPGTRFSVWGMKASSLNMHRALLAWAGVAEKDIVWVDAGSTDAAWRAIADGRADVVYGFPTSGGVIEVSSAPYGIRWIDMNSEKDPEGARRYATIEPLTSFGPMTTGVPSARGVWGAVSFKQHITQADASVDLIYHIGKWMDENYSKYKDKHASNEFMTRDALTELLKTTFIPVHDGLIRYLTEKGLWTKEHDRRQQVNVDLFTRYVDGYADCIAAADKKGIKVDPSNKDWIDLWENYKVEHKIPKIAMHPSLNQDASPVLPK